MPSQSEVDRLKVCEAEAARLRDVEAELKAEVARLQGLESGVKPELNDGDASLSRDTERVRELEGRHDVLLKDLSALKVGAHSHPWCMWPCLLSSQCMSICSFVFACLRVL